MKVYLAFPMSNRDFKDVLSYTLSTKARLIAMGYDVLYPLIGKGYLKNEGSLKAEGYDFPVSTAHAITRRDLWMVKQADVVFVNLAKTEVPPVGCIAEMAWAYLLNKHVVLVTKENNLHAFIREMADVIFNDYEEAMVYLKQLIKRSVD